MPLKVEQERADRFFVSWIRTEATTDDEERGAGLVEYALLVGLIAMVCIAAVGLLGEATGSQYSSITSAFNG